MDDINVNEVSCLAQAIYHEARGESERGQVAVAQVIINRSKDDRGRFGRDICSVVTQPKQFSGFRLGRKVGSEFYSLAKDVLSGKWKWLIGDSLYFRRGNWGGAIIGNHVFH